MMMTNEKNITITLRRIDVCYLMLACTLAGQISDGATKWGRLHDFLQQQLDEGEVLD